MRVLGVDACRSGWVGVLLDDGVATAHFGVDIAAVAQAAGPVTVIGIDIPIGLPDAGRRAADEQARKLLGHRWMSVFMTPVRPALLAGDHATAVIENRRLAGEGVSMQAYRLGPKILQVDSWVRTGGRHVVEAHPEVSFARMSGAALEPKTTWAGAEQRRALLAAEGIHLTGDLGEAGRRAGVDDVLDAAAVAWTARRVAAGTAECVPDPPEVFTDGIPAAIWV